MLKCNFKVTLSELALNEPSVILPPFSCKSPKPLPRPSALICSFILPAPSSPKSPVSNEVSAKVATPPAGTAVETPSLLSSHTPEQMQSQEASWHRGRPTRQLFTVIQPWESSLHFLVGQSPPANGDLTGHGDVPSLPTPNQFITPSYSILTPRLSRLQSLPPGVWQLLSPDTRGVGRTTGWWVSSGHRHRSPLQADTGWNLALSVTACLDTQLVI